jgi:predicted nucleic acid-binding protein
MVCRRGYLQLLLSNDVLAEAERNIALKVGNIGIERLRALLSATPFDLAPSPTEQAIRPYTPMFFEDAHVVAAALASRAEFLVTLDQRLARRVEQSGIRMAAVSPREFLQHQLPRHSAHQRIRRSET